MADREWLERVVREALKAELRRAVDPQTEEWVIDELADHHSPGSALLVPIARAVAVAVVGELTTCLLVQRARCDQKSTTDGLWSDALRQAIELQVVRAAELGLTGEGPK